MCPENRFHARKSELSASTSTIFIFWTDKIYNMHMHARVEVPEMLSLMVIYLENLL